MKKTPESIWKIMFGYCEKVKKIVKGSDITFELDDEKKAYYISNFEATYNYILSKFMDNRSEKLDRHKQAAIAIYLLLENPLIKKSDDIAITEIKQLQDGTNPVFIGNEVLALSAGLQLLKTLLNAEINEVEDVKKKESNRISNFFMPTPYYCDTPYFEIVCRNLYFQQKYIEHYFNTEQLRHTDQYMIKKALFILDFANTLYLFEYLTLIKNDIDPLCLKKNTIEQ